MGELSKCQDGIVFLLVAVVAFAFGFGVGYAFGRAWEMF